MNFQNQYNLFIAGHFHVLAAAVLALGAFFRLRRFTKKGLFLWDEASFLRETIAIDYIIKFYRKRWREMIALRLKPDARRREALVEEYRSEKKYDYVWYKVWHTVLTYLSNKIFKPADLAMAVPALVLGMTGIALAMWTGKLIGGPAAGLMAGLCLAVGGMHTLHSRSAEPEVGAATCLQAAALCSLLSKLAGANGGAPGAPLWLIAASGFFLCGLSLFNPAWIAIIVPMIVFPEAVYAVCAGSGLAAFTASVSVMLLSTAVFVVFFNIPFFINLALFPEDGVKTTFIRYALWIGTFKQIFGSLLKKKEKGVLYGVSLSPHHMRMFYLDLLLKTEGPVVFAALAGAVLLIFRAGPSGAFAVVFGAVIFGALTASTLKSSRAVVILTPLIAVYAGYFLGSALAPAAALCAALLIAAWGARMAWRIGDLTSGVRLAAEYIRSKGYNGFLCTSAPFSIVYGTPDYSYTVPSCYEAIFYRASKINEIYLIVEFHELYPSTFTDNTVNIIQKHIEPEFIVEDPCATFYPLRAEAEFINSTLKVQGTDSAFGSPEELARWNAFRLNPREKDRTVRVYNISPILSPEPGGVFFYDLQIMQLEKMYATDYEMNKKEILDSLKAMLRYYPDDHMIKYRLAVMYHEQGRHEMAERNLRAIVMDERLDLEQRKICANLLVLRELHLRASSAMDDSRLNMLSDIMEEGLIAEEFKGWVGETVFYEKATRFFEKKEYDLALVAAEERLQTVPDCPQAIFFKALALRTFGKKEESMALFQAALASGALPDHLKNMAEQMVR